MKAQVIIIMLTTLTHGKKKNEKWQIEYSGSLQQGRMRGGGAV